MAQHVITVRKICTVATMAVALAACQPPAAPPATASTPLPSVIVIGIKKDGTLTLNGAPVTPLELEERLKSTPSEIASIQLKPDRDALHDAIGDAAAAVERAGHIHKLGVIGGT